MSLEFTREQVKRDLEMLQDMIAANLAASDGERRIITQEIFEERIKHYLEVGKKELEACGPEESGAGTDFKAMATIFSPWGGEANICVAWPEGKKRAMMHALSDTCKTTLAQGVLFRHVVVAANTEELAKEMGVELPDPRNKQKMDYFEEKMWKWIVKNFGSHHLAALPKKLRWDWLISAGMGPKLKDASTAAEYRWENGKLVFNDLGESGFMRMELIPRWWQ